MLAANAELLRQTVGQLSQNLQTTIISTSVARKTVSATIRPIARPPTPAMALSDVFIPSAAIAVTKHQREMLLRATSAGAGNNAQTVHYY